jgi:hypothetical protein
MENFLALLSAGLVVDILQFENKIKEMVHTGGITGICQDFQRESCCFDLSTKQLKIHLLNLSTFASFVLSGQRSTLKQHSQPCPCPFQKGHSSQIQEIQRIKIIKTWNNRRRYR